MKILRALFWCIVAVCLVVVGLANKGAVSVNAMPPALGDLLGFPSRIDLPLYIVIFAAVGLGLLIGFLWEWLREGQMRSQSRAKTRQLRSLEKEVDGLKCGDKPSQDDVLALLGKS